MSEAKGRADEGGRGPQMWVGVVWYGGMWAGAEPDTEAHEVAGVGEASGGCVLSVGGVCWGVRLWVVSGRFERSEIDPGGWIEVESVGRAVACSVGRWRREQPRDGFQWGGVREHVGSGEDGAQWLPCGRGSREGVERVAVMLP